MRNRTALLIICSAALLLRLIIAAQAPALHPDAYSVVRQVEHIRDTGLPLTNDDLSYGGERSHTVLPVFPYIIAFSTLVLPDDLAYILLPNMLAVLLHATLYYLVLELTSNRTLSMIAAIASVFIPSYIVATLLTLSSLSIALPMLIVLATLFFKLRKTKEKRNVLLLIFIALCFTHPIAILCIPFFIITVILSVINRSRDDIAQREFALFGIFFVLWLYVLLYKRSLAAIGLETIRGNVPAAAVQSLYSPVSMLALATAVGIVPLGLSLYAAYREGLAQHIGIQATFALGLSVTMALLLQLIPLTTGLAVFSAVCIALAAVGLKHFAQYSRAFKNTTVPKVTYILIALLFISTSILPTITNGVQATRETLSPAVVEAGKWIAQNTPKDITLLSHPQWGHALAAYGQRKVYMDTDYLGRSDAEERYSTAISILESAQPSVRARTEHVDYIVSDTRLIDHCLNTVYSKEVYIAKVLCS